MSENIEYLKTGLKPFALNIKENKIKGKILCSKNIFTILKKIKDLNYDRDNKNNISKSKVIQFRDTDKLLSLNFRNINQFPKELKHIDDDKSISLYTHIDFVISCETRENYKVKNKSGEENTFELDPDENFFHDTHGRFTFYYYKDSWICLLFLEKRHGTLHEDFFIKDYLSKFSDINNNKNKLLLTKLLKTNDFKNKLLEIEGPSIFKLKNCDLIMNPEDKIGDINSNKDLIEKGNIKAEEIQLKSLEGDNAFQKFYNLGKKFLFKENIKDEELKEMANKFSLVIYGKSNKDNYSKTHNPFSEVITYSFKVKQKEDRVIDSKDFYYRIEENIKKEEYDEVFNLIYIKKEELEKIYNNLEEN